jgi:coatomer protein complex subunit gamma
MVNLEKALQEYQQHPTLEPFSILKVPLQVAPKEAPSKRPHAPTGATSGAAVPSTPPPKPTEESQELYAALLASLPQFAGIGNLFQSSKPVELTESETEYVVHCIKHIFPQHIVLQFNVTNTIKEQILEALTVKVDPSSVKGAKVDAIVPAESLPFNTPGTTYVGIRRADPVALGTCQNVLKFTVKELDQSGEPDPTGYEDEYQIEDIEIATSDYMQKTFVANFQEKWDELGETFEVVEKYSLSTLKTLQDAVKEVADYLGMQPCERTDQVPPKKSQHILRLSGNFIGGVPVLVRARMKAVENAGVVVELAVRSTNADVSAMVEYAM